MNRAQISARIRKTKAKQRELNRLHDARKITVDEYEKRWIVLLKKLTPLQKAALVLDNPHIYGYTKKTISLKEAKKQYSRGKRVRRKK